MLNTIKSLKSLDGSINYILKHGKSFIESRYVRRNPSYISCYVSSHNGCIMGCKFCWLTQQQQTNFSHVTIDQYAEQLNTVLTNTTDDLNKRQNIRVNINFMARGEALANKYVVNNYSDIYNKFNDIVKKHKFGSFNVNVSTIMPHTIKHKNLFDIFGNNPVRLYYSMYSIDPKWKQKWMPNAMSYNLALDKLKEFQYSTSYDTPITFHWAFIKNQNDCPEQVINLVNEINKRNFKNVRFNLVRFNAGKLNNEEPDISHLKTLFTILDNNLKNKFIDKNKTFNESRIVNRIGEDVYASCGMFVDDTNI